MVDYGSGPYDGSFSDSHSGKDGYVGSDPGVFMDDDRGGMDEGELFWIMVDGEDGDVRSDHDVIFDNDSA